MKTSISLFITFMLFCCSTCDNNDEYKQNLIIQNNSDQEIIVNYGSFPIDNNPFCLTQGLTDMEYRSFIDHYSIKPNSKKNFNGDIILNAKDTVYMYIYNRIDMDTMPCEEFDEKNPIKKRWALTKSDVEELNWTLNYP